PRGTPAGRAMRLKVYAAATPSARIRRGRFSESGGIPVKVLRAGQGSGCARQNGQALARVPDSHARRLNSPAPAQRLASTLGEVREITPYRGVSSWSRNKDAEFTFPPFEW